MDEMKNYDLIEGIYEELQVFDKKLKGDKIDGVLFRHNY